MPWLNVVQFYRLQVVTQARDLEVVIVTTQQH